MHSSYQQVPQNPDDSYDSNHHRPYHDDEDTRDAGYGYSTHGYNHYRPPSNSLKGKVEKKYWHTKQTMIQKLGKGQDSYVVAGDAEVDARLEAFRHIQKTCMDLLKAIEIYQNRIFALSQDENEMGRFLREQGSSDKSKAGKMMIAVGKAQSYSAQQRLSLRTPLVRLYQEVETFRFRAVSDTLQTVTRMETCRTDYRAALLWMSDISKELDPEEFRRLEKYREVQSQVKRSKKQFDRLKVDVMQKVDLLSASRCNLLSSTLAAYQQAMLKFWENTSRTMRQVYEQFKGHPTYQFQMLKSLNPMPDESEKEEKIKEVNLDQKTHVDESNEGKSSKERETAEEATEEDDDDDQLISLDQSPAKDRQPAGEDSAPGESLIETDLLGEESSSGAQDNAPSAFIDLLGGDDFPAPKQGADGFLSAFEGPPPAKNGVQSALAPPSYEEAKHLQPFPEMLSGSALGAGDLLSGQAPSADKSAMTADDLLFGSPMHDKSAEPANTVDLLNQILSGDSGAAAAEPDNSFSQKWREMFGNEPMASSTTAEPTDQSGFMPSDLLDSMGRFDPFGGSDMPSNSGPPPAGRMAAAKGSNSSGKMPSMSGLLTSSKQALTSAKSAGDKEKAKKAAGDLSAWFNLFSDLDPLANPDAVDKKNSKSEEERQC